MKTSTRTHGKVFSIYFCGHDGYRGHKFSTLLPAFLLGKSWKTTTSGYLMGKSVIEVTFNDMSAYGIQIYGLMSVFRCHVVLG